RRRYRAGRRASAASYAGLAKARWHTRGSARVEQNRHQWRAGAASPSILLATNRSRFLRRLEILENRALADTAHLRIDCGGAVSVYRRASFSWKSLRRRRPPTTPSRGQPPPGSSL